MVGQSNKNSNNNKQIVWEVLLTTKILEAKDNKERSIYTFQWKNRAHVPPQVKKHEGPETGGVLIILLGIQDILKSCPEDQPVLIELKHRRVFKFLKTGCKDIEANPKHLEFLKPYLEKLRNMMISRKATVYTKRLGIDRRYRVLGSGCGYISNITHFQPSANVGSSSSSIQPAPVIPQQEIQQVKLQSQQVDTPSIAISSRVSAFTPVLAQRTPVASSIPSSPTQSYDQLVRSSDEQISSEHQIHTTSCEGRIREPYSTIIEEPLQQQGTQSTRRSARLHARRENLEEDRREGIQPREPRVSIQTSQGATSFSSSPELRGAEASTQLVQQAPGSSSFTSSPLTDPHILPRGINSHITITKEQQNEMLIAEREKKEMKRLAKQTLQLEQASSVKTITNNNDMIGPSIVRYGGNTVTCNLTIKQRIRLLRIQHKRVEAYKNNCIKREEHLEVNRWLDNMKEDNPLKVRTTYNAYDNIPPENVLSEEERKAMGLDQKNQQEQSQPPYGIFGRILNVFRF